jgi:hypothetical protein
MEAEVRQEFNEIRAILRGVAEREAAAGLRMDRADERMDRMDARFEKRMRGFEKLAQIGMKEMVDLRRSQQRTETALQAFIASLRRGGNGHNGGRPGK